MYLETALWVAMIAFVGTVVGAGITAFINWRSAVENRKTQLELDRQKARREWRVARVTAFLERVHRRLYEVAGAVGAARTGDAKTFCEAAPTSVSAEVFSESTVISITDPLFGQALIDYLAADRAARQAVMSLAECLDASAGRLAVSPELIATAETAQSQLARSIAELDRAAESYIFGGEIG